jgi:hypothetical protein
MNRNLFVLILLILLTVLSARLAVYPVLKILLFGTSGIKFLLVAFQFMDLRHSHIFWKLAIILMVVIIFSVMAILR